MLPIFAIIIFFNFVEFDFGQASDITSQVFGSSSDGIIGAFGDFNSDELTDVFVIKENGHVLEVLLGSDVEPLLRTRGLRCRFDKLQITSVVPGDFLTSDSSQ